MIEQIEISTLDTRYEPFRLKSVPKERELLVSISEKGILSPLQGVCINGTKLLLNGFKRYRCAVKLNIGIVPYVSFASDEPSGIIELIRKASEKQLDILEQARLIDELKKTHQMTNDDIAELLSKSRAWVSMRTNLIRSMSRCVMENVFSGRFPVYSYMYTLRKFIRMKSVSVKTVDDFVKSVSGKNLSCRDIELLATAFFKGTDEIKEQIQTKSVKWNLAQLKNKPVVSENYTKTEKQLLQELTTAVTVIKKIILESKDVKSDNNNFRVQTAILTEELTESFELFIESIRRLHDLCSET